MPSVATAVPPASSEEPLVHWEPLLRFETDCWHVHHAMFSDAAGSNEI